MPYRPEPPHVHGRRPRPAVVLVNLGTPAAPSASALRPYLREFLADPRVVEIPRAIWWFILNLIIVPFRSGKSARKYASIWRQDGSPLRVYTERQAAMLGSQLAERGHEVRVVHAMRYGSPSVPEVLDALKAEGCDKILVVPGYPQYSGTTTASIFDAVFAHYRKVRNVPELRFVKHYHDHEAYLRALEQSVRAYWDQHGRGDKLVLSFHGTPKRTLLLGDPYFCECHKTARHLAARLGLDGDQVVVTFQSRFGKAEWQQPYTLPTVEELARQGSGRIDVLCPGFIADCLETLEEVDMEVRAAFLNAGGREFHYIPCLNDSAVWRTALGEIVEEHLIGWHTIQSPAMRADALREAERGREGALALGAPD